MVCRRAVSCPCVLVRCIVVCGVLVALSVARALLRPCGLSAVLVCGGCLFRRVHMWLNSGWCCVL